MYGDSTPNFLFGLLDQGLGKHLAPVLSHGMKLTVWPFLFNKVELVPVGRWFVFRPARELGGGREHARNRGEYGHNRKRAAV